MTCFRSFLKRVCRLGALAPFDMDLGCVLNVLRPNRAANIDSGGPKVSAMELVAPQNVFKNNEMSTRCSESPPEHLGAHLQIDQATISMLSACQNPLMQIAKPSGLEIDTDSFKVPFLDPSPTQNYVHFYPGSLQITNPTKGKDSLFESGGRLGGPGGITGLKNAK